MRRAAVAFSGRHPLFVVALAAAGCVVAADFDWRAGFGAVVTVGLAGCLDGNWRRGFVMALVCGMTVGMFCWRNAARNAAEVELLAGGGNRAAGRLLEDGKGDGRYWSALVRLSEGECAGRKVLWKGLGEAPVAGARIEGAGSFMPLPEMRNPGEFDQAGWLRRKGVAAVFETGPWKEETATGWLAETGAKVRSSFRDGLGAGLEEESVAARVIRAVVVGEHPRDSDEMVAAFRNSGTLHLFSVSGMHVAMVGSIGWLFLRMARVPRRWAVVCLIPLVFGYSWISGNSPPAQRAAWMASVFLTGFLFRRRPDLLSSLGVVMLGMLLWDGNLLFQAGVQLSYGVVAVIAIGTAWAARLFSWMGKEEAYLPPDLMSRWQAVWLRLRRNVVQTMAVSTAAWAGSTPLTLWHFGLVTPVSILANLPLMLIVYGMMVLGLVAGAFYPVMPEVSRMANRGNDVLARACAGTAEWFAALPGAYFQIRRENEPLLLVFDLSYGAGAACFSGGREGAVLMDCGDRWGFQYRVLPALRRLGIEPDSVVLSHPDGRHVAEGPLVWEAFPVKQVLLPVGKARSPAYRSWMAAPEAGIRRSFAGEVSGVPFPAGAWLEVLHAPEPESPNAAADDRVAVCRLHWNGWRILFTSDAGRGTERRLLESGKDLRADLIVAGRHRSDEILGDDFLDAVAPKAIIASNAPFPREERLEIRQSDYWRSRGIEVIDQGRSGGVTVKMDAGGGLRIEGFADGSEVRLKRD